MVDTKQLLGIYWSEKQLFFVQTEGSHINRSIEIDHNVSATQENIATLSAERHPLSSIIENELQKNNVNNLTANLALPTKDIIFRSFIIPWMPANDVKNVVTFEASKYIPFSLEDLSYAYHSMAIANDNNKHYRIIFVAIKNETLSLYTDILNQAGLSINLTEPAVLSLTRILHYKNIIDNEKTIALVEKEKTSGKIVIIYKGVPQFVREFQLASSNQDEPIDNQTIENRLMNEIRISLDYFNRQDSTLVVEEMILVSNENSDEVAKNLEFELGKPVRHTNVLSLIGNERVELAPFINAYGASLTTVDNTSAVFDLSSAKEKHKKLRQEFGSKPLNYKQIAITSVICLAILAASFMFSSLTKKDHETKLSNLNSKLGKFASAEKATIEEAIDNGKNDLDNYKKIRTHTNHTAFIEIVDTLLPKGTWFDSIDIQFISTKEALSNSFSRKNKKKETNKQQLPTKNVKITLNGYAYNEDVKEQFQLTNKLLRNIKKNELFSTHFEDIDINKSQTEFIENNTVTFFQISCQ